MSLDGPQGFRESASQKDNGALDDGCAIIHVDYRDDVHITRKILMNWLKTFECVGRWHDWIVSF